MRGGGGGMEETLLEDVELDGEAARTFPIFDQKTMCNSLTQDLIGSSIGGHIGIREELKVTSFRGSFISPPLPKTLHKNNLFEMIIACY